MPETGQQYSACNYFGGKDAIRDRIRRTIRRERIKQRVSQRELGTWLPSSYPQQRIVGRIESGERKLDEHISLGLMAPLGISLTHMLPFTKRLTDREKKYWEAKRRESGSGPIPAKGITLDRRVVLEQYVMFEAMSELNN